MSQVLEAIDKTPKKTQTPLPSNQNYKVQKLLRQTACYNNLSLLKKVKIFDIVKRQSQHNHSLPSIMVKMSQNKANLHLTMYRQHGKLNSSFSGYLQSEMSVTRDENQKKKIKKFKKVEDKGVTMMETPILDREENNYHDIILKMSPLVNQCYDSVFPSIRYNPTLFSYQKQVYLLGGYPQQASEEMSLFHKYDAEVKRWVQVQSQVEPPKLSFSFHTVQIYKGNMVIIGGISLQGQKGKRFNSQLLIYNLQRGEWLRTRGGVILKHHASTLFGSTLMVSGGINQKQKHSEDIYFITFTGGNMNNPLVFGVPNHAEHNQKISHHKIVHTYEIQGLLRNHIKMEGVFSFGGENQHGKLNNDLMFINVIGKGGQNLDIKFKKWEIVGTNDDRPCRRRDHSFNIINKKAIGVLAGGTNQSGQFLTDVWMFDFVRLHWTRISTSPTIQESIGSFAGHCACSMGTTIFFYNGNVEKKREKAFWSLETDLRSSKSKKVIHSTKLPSFKSIRSNKQNFGLSIAKI